MMGGFKGGPKTSSGARTGINRFGVTNIASGITTQAAATQAATEVIAQAGQAETRPVTDPKEVSGKDGPQDYSDAKQSGTDKSDDLKKALLIGAGVLIVSFIVVYAVSSYDLFHKTI